MIRSALRLLWTCTVLASLSGYAGEQLDATHFDRKGKGPSEHTRSLQAELRKTLPFEDRRDFEERDRGFLGDVDAAVLKGSAGQMLSDMSRFAVLEKGDYDSLHPSLQRQALLNARRGLYEVVPGAIWQLRGFDLANLTLVKGKTGWIVFDVMTNADAARAALALAEKHLGNWPVVAVIYSHSHIDHFGGIRGVVNEDDVRSGKVKIIAPEGFLHHAVSENVYAGNAMLRRAQYQYANALPPGPFGYVDSAIGKSGQGGAASLIAPTHVVAADFETMEIDGVRFVFQNTPGTEAPAEMNTWIPAHKAFWAAENVTGTIHNIYTLRGTLIRDALAWSNHINEALYRFGQEAEVMLASHNWPRWGNTRIQEVLRTQRDAYANLNNQVLHLANQGVTINQIHNRYQVPQSLRQSWAAHQYHGSEFHNSRGVLNRYLGYWDGNPASLAPLSPEESAPLYVEMMGGSEAILEKARALHAEGRYRHAAELLNKLVYAEPSNQVAKDLLADVFEQLGYQYESTSMRNVHLVAAMELRNGYVATGAPSRMASDLMRGLTTQQFWEGVAIRVDSSKADALRFTLNFRTPDNGEVFVVEMSGGTLTVLPGYQAASPDATMSINRADLESVIMGQTTLAQQVQSGVAKIEGNAAVLMQLAGVLVNFDPQFEIMPGTRRTETH
jgi:alkyl sulfatase BDS1-like metallo-beta-lactamase superfamily hydrolase